MSDEVSNQSSEINENARIQTVSDFDGKINNKSTIPNFLDEAEVKDTPAENLKLKVKTSSLCLDEKNNMNI